MTDSDKAQITLADGTHHELVIPSPAALAGYKEQCLTSKGEAWEKDYPNWSDAMVLGILLALDLTSEVFVALRDWVAKNGTHGKDCAGNRRVRNVQTNNLDRGPCDCGLRDFVPEADARLDTEGTREN